MQRKHEYAHYSLKDFNKYDCLKLSIGIYALLVFVCRGYIIWIMSISNMQNRTDTIALAFPDPKLFYLSLLSGAVGLFVILIISLRRPDTYNWVKFCWKHIRKFLLISLFFDLAVSMSGYFYFKLLSYDWLVIQTALTLLFTVFLYLNNRVRLNIQEFPEVLPEK
jgi:hypothetical protein